jgi:archaeosine synthase alpha-subunit
MLNIHARDASARAGILTVDERPLEFPAIFWIDEELGPNESNFEPILARRENPHAILIRQTNFQKRPAENPGQILLERRLEPTPAMAGGRVRVDQLGAHMALFNGALSLSRNPKRFAPAVAQARTQAGYTRLLYAPGLGEPAQLAVMAYAGVELFDATPLSYAAARGQYLTTHGSFPAASITRPECVCPACQTEAPASFTEEELRRHNQWAAWAEMGVVRNAIRDGRLRELVEARVRSHPELTALLRRIDQQSAYMEERTPLNRKTPLYANTKESLKRPEVMRFRQRVLERYQPKVAAPVLLLLPCSHRKPYSKSRTHHAFTDTLWEHGAAGLVHEVILTSPLGLVPRELELTFPAAHYDVPVTGEWDEEEGTMIRAHLSNLLSKRKYERIVSHLPKHTYELVVDLLPADTIVTCTLENATLGSELQRLGRALDELKKEFRPTAIPKIQLGRLHGLATYQFGAEAADALLKDANCQGKWPTGKLFVGGEQLAMLPTERGLLSLTIPGGKRIAATGNYVVEIEDFPVKGSIFAVGVKDADPQIRVGDDVVVCHNGEVRGVGVASMTGNEMIESKRGEAVRVRHHA